MPGDDIGLGFTVCRTGDCIFDSDLYCFQSVRILEKKVFYTEKYRKVSNV